MNALKAIIIAFALVGLVAFIQHSLRLLPQIKPAAVLSESVETKSSLVEGALPQDEDTIAIPTLDQSIELPKTELVDCSKKAADGTYQFNFGQLPKDICLEKIKKLQDGWEKEFDKLLENQKEENYNSSLIVPNDLEFKE